MLLIFLIAVANIIFAQALPNTKKVNGRVDWNQECGLSRKAAISTRIVGGQDASIGDWPWMAAVLYQGRLRCGGALISNQHVLTTARCISRFKASSVTVRLGQFSLSEADTDTEYAVKDMLIHPGYDVYSNLDDIAVLKLAQTVKMNDDIHRICLPPADQQPEKKTAYVAGWGFTEHQGQISDDLQEISVPIWTNTLCSAALNQTILESQLCAGRIAGGADSCEGDAGGPLMTTSESGRWEVTGIVSYGSACGRGSTPSVYTRIATYLEWIQEQLNSTNNESASFRQRRCGFPAVGPSRRKKRLVGGDPADEGKWPWQAALVDKFGSQFCGGVLITNQHVLTSAFCAVRTNASEFQVRLGGYDVRNRTKSQKLSVAKVHVHDDYKRTGSQTFNDIALLSLSSPVTFSDNVQHVCLPHKRLSLEGRTAFVTAWGSTSKTTEYIDVVNEIQLPIWNQEECKDTYDLWGVEITDDHFCAGDRSGGKDACLADRGGPLVYQQTNGQWAVIGLVSFSKGCADPGIPGVYTRVNNFEDWIRTKVLL